MSPVDRPILEYLDFKGKAESSRLAFFIGGIDFEDRRVTRDQFLLLKDKYPFGQLPVLHVDGHTVAQSIAILLYAGRLANLVPQDDILHLRMMSVITTIEEMYGKFAPSIREEDPEKKAQMRQALADSILPFWMSRLEKIVGKDSPPENANMYCVGDTLTVADLQLYVVVSWLVLSGVVDGIPTTLCDDHKNILKIIKTVGDHPKVVEWGEKERLRTNKNK